MRDTLKKFVIKTLTWEARIALMRHRPYVIGITGSVGKTSTKDAFYALMQPYFKVRKSEKSFNSEFGIPLTILGLPNAWNNEFAWGWNILQGFWKALFVRRYPEYLVLEVGADSPGDIKNIAHWLNPRTAVVTRFPEVPVHIEFFNSKEEVIEEKSALAKAIRPGGLLILNRDDEKVFALADELSNKKITITTYGQHPKSDIWLRSYSVQYGEKDGHLRPVGITGFIEIEGLPVEITLKNTINKNHLLAFLPGFAFMKYKGKSTEAMVSGIETFSIPPGRMTILEGINGSTLLDDSYNASPIAVESALETLHKLEVPNRKIAVLGDMMELGKFTEEEHRKIGVLAARAVNILITIGIRAKFTHEEALAQKNPNVSCIQVDTHEKAIELLSSLVSAGDTVLFKGSQSSRLEKIIAPLLFDKKQAEKMLVRQDEEWQKR